MRNGCPYIIIIIRVHHFTGSVKQIMVAIGLGPEETPSDNERSRQQHRPPTGKEKSREQAAQPAVGILDDDSRSGVSTANVYKAEQKRNICHGSERKRGGLSHPYRN